MSVDGLQDRPEAEESGIEEQGGGVDPTPETGAAALQLSFVFERAVQMFAVGAEAAIVFVLIPLAGEPSVELCTLVKQAIHELYKSKQYRVLIGRSPERPDLRLSQEEALGYLLGAVLGVELLQQEARSFGSKVEFQATQEKNASEAAKETEKSKKKAARAAAKKSAEAAAALDATLAGIDAEGQVKRAARRAQVPPKLVLPRGSIVEPRQPPAAAPPLQPQQTATQRRTKVDKAEEAAARADADEVAARRRWEKAEAALKKIGDKRLAQSSGWLLDDEAYARLLVERVETDREWEQLRATAHQLSREWTEACRAANDTRYAAEEARSDATVDSEFQQS
eukprot:6285880-Prymnesium_polylepis.2